MKKVVIGILLAAIVLVNGMSLWMTHDSSRVLSKENLTRIEAPEQTESMENENFIKEEYISVLPEGNNIASEGKISSDGFTGSYTEKKAVDGKVEGNSYWEGTANLYPNDLTITFEEARKVHALRIAVNPQNIWGKRTQSFAVLLTDKDGKQQTFLPQNDYVFDPDYGNEVILEFDETEFTAISLEFYGNTGATGGQVAEFEIYE